MGPRSMLDANLLSSIATQLMNARQVDVGGHKLSIGRTSLHRFKTVTFTMNGREYMAIEQNASKPSYWGSLARKGHQVVQFKDVKTNRFVAVAVDGDVGEYGTMHRRKRPAN
jgi:hypothetical protein